MNTRSLSLRLVAWHAGVLTTAFVLLVPTEGAYAVLDVTDTGIGIPPSALPHVFKRFFRLDGSRSREQGGAGLGLSIVKSICSAHGTTLEVSSAPGQGSTFRVKQPLADSATGQLT